MRESNYPAKNRSGRLLGLMIVAIVSFAAGMRSDAIFGAMAPLIGMRVETGTIDLSSVQETYRQLKANYDGDIDIQKLIYGANKGLASAIGDPHTAYLDPSDVERLNNDINGDIGGGIGAEIITIKGQTVIVRPLPGGPAEKVGLKQDDVLLEINGESVVDVPSDQTVYMLRGDIGTKVKLVVARKGEPKEFEVIRQEVKQPTVEARIEGENGILRVNMFNKNTGQLARAEADKFIKSGVKRVILDLRGNPGGEVGAAQGLAGLWLQNEIILEHRRGGKVIQADRSYGTPILGDINTVVLINGYSASASEIVAAALKDYGKAKLVGVTTYGKGSVQRIVRLGGGAELKVTEARWFTSKGVNIDKLGIKPDIEVKMTADDIERQLDPQLDKAKEI